LGIDTSVFADPCLKETEYAYYIDYFTQWAEILSNPASIEEDL
jgi:hypothetical protein